MSDGVNPTSVKAAEVSGTTTLDPIRAALTDIVAWSEDAPSWQRDALRRLYAQPKLTPEDEAELYQLCRQPHALLEDGVTPVTVQPLDTSHVPANWHTGGAVALKSIGRARNVNVLADDQTLHFAEQGLTVVYGDNGAGKSGYGRVLKRACRARDQEPILPDAYGPQGGKPSARIKYAVAGAVQAEVLWEDGVAVSPDLSNISVFDSKCASVHVDGTHEVAYTPIPLRLLQTLADLARKLGAELKTQKTALEARIPSFRKKPSSREGTAVHQLILGLSASTTSTALDSLVELSDHETQRLDQLRRDLAADPAKEVRRLTALKQRVQQLGGKVRASETVLLPAKTEELRQLLQTERERATAAQLAAKEAFSEEPLPQAGSEAWKTLWEAARAFSTVEAYSDTPFPNTSEEAVCVLCQQPLSARAADRLRAFEAFVQQKVQQAVEEARRNVDSWKDTLRRSIASKDELGEAMRLLRDELDESATCRGVVRLLARARVRGKRLCGVADPALLRQQQAVPVALAQLAEVVAGLDARIQEFQKSSDPAQRRLLANELHGLEDRVWLASIKEDVEAEVARLKRLSAFEKALQDTDTTRITRKTTELSKSLVTNTLRDAFAAETTALSIADRRLELTQEASGYGSTKFKVSLIRNPKAKVASVLSEGEHRCVALAAFLAELSTAHNRSGVVFDDPVSSLDHNFRELVADRLAKEAAAGRQVIVLTHDIPFLMMLDEAARARSINPLYQCVNRADDRAGICETGAPLKARPVPEIVDKVERRLATSMTLHSQGRLDEWADQVKAMSGLLRDGWERASEFAVAPVVRRFDNSVHTGGLRKLTVLTVADCEELKKGYAFCCTYCHTDPPGVNRPTPTPDTIQAEAHRLRDWYESVRSRQDSMK